MEFYLFPNEAASAGAFTRTQILEALAGSHLAVERTEEEAGPAGQVAFWRVFLAGSEAVLHFQERKNRLTFATVEHYMHDDPGLVERACAALEGAGWEFDEDNVG